LLERSGPPSARPDCPLAYLFIAYSCLALVLSIFAAPARGQDAEKPKEAIPQRSSAIIVPVSTTMPLALKNTINSRTAFVGQAIYCETIYPIALGNRIVIPVGTYVKGAVTQVVRPGRVKGKSQVGIRFDTITLPNGTTRPLRATLSSYAGQGNETFRAFPFIM
jgi:type IV secretory pathway VirB10-like protein